MSLPLNAAVRRGNDAGSRLGVITRGPHRAPRGMLWVLWEGCEAPALWNRVGLVYVARRYQTATAWRKAMESGVAS